MRVRGIIRANLLVAVIVVHHGSMVGTTGGGANTVIVGAELEGRNLGSERGCLTARRNLGLILLLGTSLVQTLLLLLSLLM